MGLKVPTKSAADLTMGNTTNVCVWASANRLMKSPKRCDYAGSAESDSAQKGCICHAILNEGEKLFQSTADIYIYIYIYIKADRNVTEIKFGYPMFACEGKL